jgi:hypothetical protein
VKGIEELLVELIPVLLPGPRVSTDIPANLAAVLPYIRVTRVGGPRRLNLTKPSVDIDVFAADRLTATNLANQLDDLLVYKLPTTYDGHVIGLEGAYSGPSWRPYENGGVSRVGASYGFLLHHA